MHFKETFRIVRQAVSIKGGLRTQNADRQCIKRGPGIKRGLQTRYKIRTEFSKTVYRTKLQSWSKLLGQFPLFSLPPDFHSPRDWLQIKSVLCTRKSGHGQ